MKKIRNEKMVPLNFKKADLSISSFKTHDSALKTSPSCGLEEKLYAPNCGLCKIVGGDG